MSDMSERGVDGEPCGEQHFVTCTKVVYSGQVRHYYAASCDCGWMAERFRVTKQRAHDLDFLPHIEVPPGEWKG